ncbi:MarR family transcriptional regulator [Halobacteriales archaeon QS_9_67_17]|nr:MAG: MarR family transcriptional regulator [Halobacteriales archaeon QS_9_67_17]
MTDAADAEDPVELGVQLLERLEHESLPLPEVIDRIETVTTDATDAATTRQILETAERRGIIDREAGTVRPNRSSFLSFEAEVVSKEGEFTCRRCDASISTGYFMRLDAGEHGPFGSTCIRKVTGRE